MLYRILPSKVAAINSPLNTNSKNYQMQTSSLLVGYQSKIRLLSSRLLVTDQKDYYSATIEGYIATSNLLNQCSAGWLGLLQLVSIKLWSLPERNPALRYQIEEGSREILSPPIRRFNHKIFRNQIQKNARQQSRRNLLHPALKELFKHFKTVFRHKKSELYKLSKKREETNLYAPCVVW